MSDAKDQLVSPTPSIQKYSRYRNVSRATSTASASPPPGQADEKQKDAAIARSMSRYRARPRVPSHAATMPDTSSVPAVPLVSKTMFSQSLSTESRPVDLDRSPVRRATDGTQRQQERGDVRRPRETEAERARRKAREAAQAKLRAQEAADAEERRIKDAEEEARRILAEQKRKDLERLEAELEAAAPARVASPREKLKFFSRKIGSSKTSPPPTASSGSVGDSQISRARTRSNEPAPGNGPPNLKEQPRVSEQPRARDEPRKPEARSLEPPKAIEQGGGGIVPQTDAPVSASNAGERRVLIRCKQSSINLPITPETTPVELIYSAANIMTQNISVSTCLVLESYTQLGLERRLRRYEPVRDVMNSWDRDTQNALILQNSDSPNHDKDLLASSVPREAPGDITVNMYHSQKPGKWNKRYITLLSTGQIFLSKKPGTKVTEKDAFSICHLSDFDIYTPTPQQLRKTLRPPKKHCYAIKSQQKTTMFLSTENFVHFFCTDDLPLSEKWYTAVQQWRSWYLVNRLGEGRKAAKGKATKKLTTEVTGKPGTKAGHSVKVSVDESPYTIGSFQPLMKMDRFGSPSKEQDYDSEEENRPRQIPFHLRNSVAMNVPTRAESRRHPPPVNYKLPPSGDEDFAASGLLGRTYTQRQKQQQTRERESALNALDPSGPFIEGPSLLNGSVPQRTMSMKSAKTKRPDTSNGAANATAGSGLQRANSQRQKPKPLLDFTPTFREAPQWDKTGKGHGVKAVEGVPLVEVATGPSGQEAGGALGMPQTVFRRDQSRPKTGGGGGGSGGAREGGEGAFVKGGLISGL